MEVITVTTNTTSPFPVPSLSPLDGWVNFYEFQPTLPPGFGGPTPQLQRLAMRVFTSGEVTTWPSPCGANCSYTITFDGPMYDCIDTLETNPVNISPQSNELYLTTPGYINTTNTTDTTSSATQISDGIWIRRNLWDNVIHTSHCVLHVATYTTNVTYKENIQYLNTSVQLHDPILSSVFDDLFLMMTNGTEPGIKLNQTVSLVNFYAIEQAVEGLLQGFIHQSTGLEGVSMDANAQIFLWKFVEYGLSTNGSTPDYSLIAYPSDFSNKVEELLKNLTLSLISNPQTSTKPLGPALPFNFDVHTVINTTVPALVAIDQIHYAYSPRTLWEIYGVAIGVSAICTILGLCILVKNGVDSDMSFSQILVTTRNPSLDTLCDGASLGGEKITEDIKRVKLKYGELIRNESEEQSHACFGLEKEVIPLENLYRKNHSL